MSTYTLKLTGTLTAEQVRKCVESVYYEGYADGYAHRGGHLDETDWQEIADKLNALIGGELKVSMS